MLFVFCPVSVLVCPVVVLVVFVDGCVLVEPEVDPDGDSVFEDGVELCPEPELVSLEPVDPVPDVEPDEPEF